MTIRKLKTGGRTIKQVNLGNTELKVTSTNGVVSVDDLGDIDELQIKLGPELKLVELADGSKTVITTRLLEYIENNGSWEVVDDE